MADVTIGDLNDLVPPMNGNELMEVERSGVSYRVKSGDVAQAPSTITAVTSGAAPVDLDPLALLHVVTTGGTGVEVLNLPNPTLDANSANAPFVGRRLVVYLAALTDPGDSVHMTVAGSPHVPLFNQVTNDGVSEYTDTRLEYEGAAIAFIWRLDSWALMGEVVDFAFNWDNYQPASMVFHAGDATADFSAQTASFRGGNGNVDNPAGGFASLSGGDSNGATAAAKARVKGGDSGSGAGGDVELLPGTGGTDGFILARSLPGADPHVVDALYAVAGVVKISAGPP